MKQAKKMKWGIKVLIGISCVFLFIFVIGLIVFFVDMPARAELKKLEFAQIDFTNLKDGEYIGEYNGSVNNLRDVTVKVTVEGGAVTKIEIVERGDIAPEVSKKVGNLFNRIIDDQSLDVELISGATLTANAHLKAVENALLKAQGND